MKDFGVETENGLYWYENIPTLINALMRGEIMAESSHLRKGNIYYKEGKIGYYTAKFGRDGVARYINVQPDSLYWESEDWRPDIDISDILD